MAAAVMRGPVNYAMLNTETRLGEDTIGPGLTEDLQKFYEKADNFSDKAKCLELLNAISLGDSVQRNSTKRPQTAAPVVGGEHSKNFLSPYQTSYNRDYPLKQPIDTVAHRPMTSQGFAPQLGPGPDTHYGDEYKTKPRRPVTPQRPGSASGQRANNPHPPQTFMVWKFPRGGWKNTEGGRWSEELTDDKINQVHKRLCQSTYQTDYLGSPQGFDLKSAYSLPPDWKENIPYTLDSVQRYCYQRQTNPNELQLPVNRYGSNKKKHLPASGTIPTASSRHKHIRNRTTYDRHYNDNADAVTQQIRDIGHKLGAEALRKYYDNASGDDRTMARHLLEAYGGGRRLPPTPTQTPQQAPLVARAPTPQAHLAARPPSARPPTRLSHRSSTPASTPITPPYVPMPPAKNPNASRLSFNVFSEPQALES